MTTIAAPRKIGAVLDSASLVVYCFFTAALIYLFVYSFQVCGATLLSQIGEKLGKAEGVLFFMWPFNFFAGLIMVQWFKQAPRKMLPRFLLALLPLYCSLALIVWSALKWHIAGAANCATDATDSWQYASNVILFNTVVPTLLIALYKGHRLFFLGFFSLIFTTIFAVSLLAGLWL